MASKLSFFALSPAELLPSNENVLVCFRLCLIPPLLVFCLATGFDFLAFPCSFAMGLAIASASDFGFGSVATRGLSFAKDFGGMLISDLKKGFFQGFFQPYLDDCTCIYFWNIQFQPCTLGLAHAETCIFVQFFLQIHISLG